MKYLITRSTWYSVEETGSVNKPLMIRLIRKGGIDVEPQEYTNAGRMIKSMGGVEKFLTLCRDEAYYQQCKTNLEWFKSEEFKAMQQARKAVARQQHAEFSARMTAEREKAYNDLLSASNGVIETTIDNIGIILRYLNTKNWGGWKLPRMTIGYSCHQYDCDGKTATTMKLDEPIDYYGEPCACIVSGGRVGHLIQYRRI